MNNLSSEKVLPEVLKPMMDEYYKRLQQEAEPQKTQEIVLTNPGTIPQLPGQFAALIENLESEKISFLLNDCPEIEISSIIPNLNFDETGATEAIEGLSADIRYTVESVAKIQSIDPVFSLSGFLQAIAVCSGLRVGVYTTPDNEHRELGTLHVLSIGHSSDGKGRGVVRYASIIDRVASEINLYYEKARKEREEFLTDEEKKEKKQAKIRRIPHFRTYTTSPTEGAIIDIHTDNLHCGVALWVDEAGNALRELTKFTKGGGEDSAMNLLINGFDAKRPHIQDRKRRDGEEGYTAVEKFGMSFLGGLQTQYATKFFNGGDGKSRGRGMAQRFLSFHGTEISESKEEITIESLFKSKDRTDSHEVNTYLLKKMRAMMDCDRISEFYDLVLSALQDDGLDIRETNEMISFGLNKNTIFFQMQPHALLELAQFKQALRTFKQECEYSVDEKSSIAYDAMKVDKLIAILHYFKWCDFKIRALSPSYYIATGMHTHAEVLMQYRKNEPKYCNIANIPVTVDTVQASIKIVLYSATCRRGLFDEVKDDISKKIMDFEQWVRSSAGEKIMSRNHFKTFTIKEIMKFEIPAFDKMGQNQVKEFLKKHMRLSNKKERRGFTYDFDQIDCLKTVRVLVPSEETIKRAKRPSRAQHPRGAEDAGCCLMTKCAVGAVGSLKMGEGGGRDPYMVDIYKKKISTHVSRSQLHNCITAQNQ